MRRVSTEYVCDSCESKVKGPKELRRFRIEQTRRGRAPSPVIAVDLCDTCEAEFVGAMQQFVPSDYLGELREMRREEAAA